MIFAGRRQFARGKGKVAWGGIPWSQPRRYNSTTGAEIDPEVKIIIGRNTERLILETGRFLERGYSTRLQSLLHPQVTLLIQNSPEDVLLRVNGEQMYRRVYQVLRWATTFWYGLRYDRLRVHVFATGLVREEEASPFRLRLKWRVEGYKKTFPWIWSLRDDNGIPSSPLISGYSYYQFDQSTGMVRQHAVDRLVPPAARGSLLWRCLERLQVNPPVPAKPLVGSSSDTTSA